MENLNNQIIFIGCGKNEAGNIIVLATHPDKQKAEDMAKMLAAEMMIKFQGTVSCSEEEFNMSNLIFEDSSFC